MAATPSVESKSAASGAGSESSSAGSSSSAAAAAAAVASPERLAAWNTWRETRRTRLYHDDGWLTLCGLDWLEVGENKVGSGDTCPIHLPSFCPEFAATLVLAADESVRILPAPGVSVLAGGAEVASGGVEVKSDAKGPATVIQIPSSGAVGPTPATGPDRPRLSFFVIKRDTKIGVRMKDRKNPVYEEFTALEYFPYSESWAVPAVYRPHAGGTKILPTTNMYGLNDPQKSPGVLEFKVADQTLTLDVAEEDDEPDRFFILFKDKTNGKETYGMRYMYCAKPAAAKAGAAAGASASTVIDFNTCYSPPCCFTSYATCAIPPKQNHLPIRVTAGELMYGKHH